MTAPTLIDPLGLVVPVYDEAGRLGEFCEPLLDFIATLPAGSELVIVDDGSSDGTVALAKAHLVARPEVAARVLERPHLGKGAAVVAGLEALSTPLRAFCDLDLSTPLAELHRIVVAGARPGVLAIGSRDLTGSSVVRPESRAREVLGKAYNRLLQATVAPGVVDTQCGAKAATAGVWEAVLTHTREEGFAWDAEAVAVAVALGLEVQEVPIEWHHDDRSKVHVLRDGLRMVRATPRIWRRRRAAMLSRSSTSPQLREGEVFDEHNAELLMGSDRTHWWFRSKAAFVATALRRTAPASGATGWLVDAGAGAGGVTALLGWAPDRVAVLEGNGAMVRQALSVHGLAGVQAHVGALPVADGSAAVVCLLDVIEHLEDPVPALAAARRALALDGRVVVNVPGHPRLWSQADVELGHVQRYTRSVLRRQLADAGLEPILMTHVFSWLVPPVWLARRVVKPSTAELGLDQTSPVIDVAGMVLTWFERQLLGRRSLPLGTSVLCVAVRDDAAG